MGSFSPARDGSGSVGPPDSLAAGLLSGRQPAGVLVSQPKHCCGIQLCCWETLVFFTVDAQEKQNRVTVQSRTGRYSRERAEQVPFTASGTTYITVLRTETSHTQYYTFY